MMEDRIDRAGNWPRANATARGSGPMIATALVCDSPLTRNGLEQILAGTSFAVAEVLHALDEEPGLVIIEANPARLSEVIRQARARVPQARIVALANDWDCNLVQLGFDAGANGFCLTASSREVLITSLELVMLGETVLPWTSVRSSLDQQAQRLRPEPQGERVGPLASNPGARLTPRETEVLRCLMDGSTNKLIARELSVNEATVKVHVKAILRKIGLANRTQAALWATENLPTRGQASR